jgi:hypothetical protein
VSFCYRQHLGAAGIGCTTGRPELRVMVTITVQISCKLATHAMCSLVVHDLQQAYAAWGRCYWSCIMDHLPMSALIAALVRRALLARRGIRHKGIMLLFRSQCSTAAILCLLGQPWCVHMHPRVTAVKTVHHSPLLFTRAVTRASACCQCLFDGWACCQ